MGRRTFQQISEQRHAEALDKLVAGETLRLSERGAVPAELRAYKTIDPAAWAAMTAEQRRSWLTSQVSVDKSDSPKVEPGSDAASRMDAKTERHARRNAAKQERRARLEATNEELRAAAGQAPKVEVRTYRTNREFEADANKRLAEGWLMSGQVLNPGRTRRGKRAVSRGITASLFLPGVGTAIAAASGAMSNKKDATITVTWTRQSPPLAEEQQDG